MTVKNIARATALAASLLVASLGQVASAADAVLYELTENMFQTSTQRSATSVLSGRANVGTPICPRSIVDTYSSGASSCAIIVSGSDSIDKVNGLGTLNGTFTVVVEAENTVDGEELEVSRGAFSGSMDYSPVIKAGTPYGSVTGTMTVDGAAYFYHGIFRLPFLGSFRPGGTTSATLRNILCPLSPLASTLLGTEDVAWLDITSDKPSGACTNVAPTALVLDEPPVRFDVTFETLLKSLVAAHSNKCVDIPSDSYLDGTQLQQMTCDGNADKSWTLAPAERYYQIVSKLNGKCLDVSGSSSSDGARVVQNSCQTKDSQRWMLKPSGAGYALVAKHSQKCLDVEGASTANGAHLIQWPCHGGTNQQWKTN
jgi:hypothetical protein